MIGITIGFIILLVLAFAFLFAALIAKYKSVEINWRLEGIRFGAFEIRSYVHGRPLLWIYVKLILAQLLLAACFAGIGYLIFSLIDPALSGSVLSTGSPYNVPKIESWSFVFAGLGYLILLLALGVVQRFFLQRGVWQIVLGSLSLSHLEALDAVIAKGDAVSGLGEGLADGLDVGGM